MTAQNNSQLSGQNKEDMSANNNLLLPDSRGNITSTKTLGQPDATVEQPLTKRCYTVEELQVILSCSRETVYALLAEHQFRWFRLGGQRGPYRISCKSFDEWLDHAME